TDSISGFTNYPGQIGLTIDPSLISTTTWFRRKVNSGSCVEYSNAIKAEVIDCSGFEDYSGLRFNVYPVPNAGEFTLEYNSVISDGTNGNIYSAQGELVKSFIIPAGQSRTEIQLDVQPGLYLIVLHSGDDVGLKKITIE
ncbi:MAG TPA: T9SS type A sorting domain-containing protein, partial [Bacteroidales bacterium]|nr:T9SS type A sorting domain-containing protein [Bacteroidales bacterium]